MNLSNMKAIIENLQNKYNLEIVSPFLFEVENKTIKFFCLIKGYGATKGMIIDSNWKKIEPVYELLVESGYGFSCFELDVSAIDDFESVLNDWGKIIS